MMVNDLAAALLLVGEELARLRASLAAAEAEADRLRENEETRERGHADERSALHERLRVAEKERDEARGALRLFLRWEGTVDPHGGIASDIAFARSLLGRAGGGAI
jgi:hypothetical protein